MLDPGIIWMIVAFALIVVSSVYTSSAANALRVIAVCAVIYIFGAIVGWWPA